MRENPAAFLDHVAKIRSCCRLANTVFSSLSTSVAVLLSLICELRMEEKSSSSGDDIIVVAIRDVSGNEAVLYKEGSEKYEGVRCKLPVICPYRRDGTIPSRYSLVGRSIVGSVILVANIRWGARICTQVESIMTFDLATYKTLTVS